MTEPAAPLPPTPRLLLAGAPAVHLAGGAALPLAWHDAALLAWLALEGPTARSRLIELLWPGRGVTAGRNSLRQRLFRLRQQLGTELVAGQEMLALAAGVSHDLDAGDGVLGELAPATVGATSEFARWLEARRAQCIARRRRELAEHSEHAERARDWHGALAHAGELLALEPLSEAAHRRVMRLHYLAGDRAAALLAFDRCERVMKDEVGARPDAETLALLATIERAAAPRAGVPAAVLRPPRMVGRARELASLRAAVESGRHVLVVGEGGMGKSRLLAELVALHGEVTSIGARPGDASLPYALFARLVRGQIGAGHMPAGGFVPELARFVPELGAASTERFEPGRFEHAAEQWLRALPPVPVVVDDLHFADGASIELLARLAVATGLPPLVLGLRPADGASELSALQDSLAELQRSQRIALRPLDAAALAELVDTLGLPELAGSALAEPLLRHTGGNPQFVLETLRTLLVEGGAHGPQKDALPLPSNVGALIERRLKRLSPAALRLARMAAVAGGDFGAELAAQVLGCTLLDLADPWAELEAAQVLADSAFAHDLVYEAVRASVPQALARPLHAGVAQALEAARGAPGAIGQHWLAAGELERAVAPLERAAEQAASASRLREAAELLAQLAQVHERRGDRAARFAVLDKRFDHVFELDVGEVIDAALDELDLLAAGDAEQAAALVQRTRAGLVTKDLQGSQAAGQRAVELARRAGVRRVECNARCVLAQVFLLQRRPDEAAQILSGMQDWIDDATLPFKERLHYQQSMAWLVLEQERYREALERWQRVGEMSAGLGAVTLSTTLNYQMLCLGYSGRFAKAAEVGERQRALIVEYRLFGNHSANTDQSLALMYANAGRYTDALAALDRADASAVAHRPTSELRRAGVYLALGQPGRARAFAQRALENAADDAQRRLPSLMLLRVLAAIEPTPELDAEREALLATADRLAAPLAKTQPRAMVRLVEAEVTRGERRLAAADAALALLAGGEMNSLQLAAAARRVQALLELGRPEGARAAAETALALGEAYVPELMSVAEAGLVVARVLAALGDARAPRVLAAAADWLHQTAATHVPPEFRDSFMRRIPAHRELLMLAAGPLLEGAAPARLVRRDERPA